MFSPSAEAVKNTILAFLWTECLWELYLSIRQYRKASAATEVPPEVASTMSPDTFASARRYTLAKSIFVFVQYTFSILISTIVIQFGLLALVWTWAEALSPSKHGEVLTSAIWLCILSTISTIIDLPLSLYNTFVLEQKFGFNKQTGAFFAWDKLKSFVVGQILTMMISSVIIVTIQNGGDFFFVWLWLVVCIISLILLTVYPSLIAPLFDKYTELPAGELRTQIEALAASLRFPLKQLYVVEGSKRSSHSNAYFYGLFNSKRIVLFDTLLAGEGKEGGCSNAEILAVLSHELGHWSRNHVTKNLILMQVNLFLMFAGFGAMFRYEPIYAALGFEGGARPVLVGLLIVLQYVMMPYNAVLIFLMTWLSRRFEFEADRFAVGLGRGRELVAALVQLNKDNLGFPVHDDLYSAWHHSHPPLLERIAAIRAGGAKGAKKEQ